MTSFINERGFGAGGQIMFRDDSSAGNGTFFNQGPAGFSHLGGFIEFFNRSSADHATFTIEGSPSEFFGGAAIYFFDHATAGKATFDVKGATRIDGFPGAVSFFDDSTMWDGTFTAEAGLSSFGGGIALLNTASADRATVIVNANSSGGGAIGFHDNSRGGSSRIELLGPLGGAMLIIDVHKLPGVTIGSIEGDGQVVLGANNLSVGANDLSTTFSGVIVDGESGNVGGSLSKVGIGTLTLAGANTYTGGTTVSSGAFAVNNTSGSATGTGAVLVNAGTLAGSGIISGPITVGTGSGAGAFLAPAAGTARKATLTMQSALTFQSDATYTYTFKAKGRQAKTDNVIANGVTINGGNINLIGTTQGTLRTGLVLTVISNTAATPIAGTFSNLTDGAIVTINGNNFQADYQGGDGNDLTLTVVP